MRVLLDTNVVLDFVLERSQFFDEADGIFLKCRNKEIEAFVSPITPINVFYTTRKEIDKATAFSAVEELLNLVEIAQSSIKIYQDALLGDFSDHEDAVQHESAVAENLDALVTRNQKDFNKSKIKVYSSAEFLQRL